MATLKRRLGNLFTHLSGLNLSRKGEGWKLMELETLSRFLSDFQVDWVAKANSMSLEFIREAAISLRRWRSTVVEGSSVRHWFQTTVVTFHTSLKSTASCTIQSLND
jgi:hypothetical protein